jgi:hypothetical protein
VRERDCWSLCNTVAFTRSCLLSSLLPSGRASNNQGGGGEQWFEEKNLVRTGRTPPSVRPRLDAEIERRGKASWQPSCISTRHQLRLAHREERFIHPLHSRCGEDERANQIFHAGLKLLLRFPSSPAALHAPLLPESIFLDASSCARRRLLCLCLRPACFLLGQGGPGPDWPFTASAYAPSHSLCVFLFFIGSL